MEEGERNHTGVLSTEVEAVNVENEIRSDFGLAPRKAYNGVEVAGKGTKRHPSFSNASLLTDQRETINTSLGYVKRLRVIRNKKASYKYYNLYINGKQEIFYDGN